MMTFDIITLFPPLFSSFVSEGIVCRAQKNKRIRIRLHNPRDRTNDKHRLVDDRPYGGGPGMLLKIEPLVKTLRSIKRMKRSRVIFLTPAGNQFTQKRARTFANKYAQLIIICGRYEGVDARIKYYIDEELSIGPYILNGGEVAAMAVIEATARLITGVIGNTHSLAVESHGSEGAYEYPQYTRPEIFDEHRAPSVLLTGDHKRISLWREKHLKQPR